MNLGKIENGVLTWLKAEAAAVEAAAEPIVAKFRALIAPEEERAAQHLASILQEDGLAAVQKIGAAYVSGDPQAAQKAAYVALDAMGKDVKSLGMDELQRAIKAAQAQSAAATPLPLPTPEEQPK